MALLHPKEITIPTPDGKEWTYIISKFPATVGQEILERYNRSVPRPGEPDDMLLPIMRHVALTVEGRDEPLRLSTEDLINTHVPDCFTLALIEEVVLCYNFSPAGTEEPAPCRVSVSFGNIVIHTGGDDVGVEMDLESGEDEDQPGRRILQ